MTGQWQVAASGHGQWQVACPSPFHGTPVLSTWGVAAFSKLSGIVKAAFPTEGLTSHVGVPYTCAIPWDRHL